MSHIQFAIVGLLAGDIESVGQDMQVSMEIAPYVLEYVRAGQSTQFRREEPSMSLNPSLDLYLPGLHSSHTHS